MLCDHTHFVTELQFIIYWHRWRLNPKSCSSGEVKWWLWTMDLDQPLLVSSLTNTIFLSCWSIACKQNKVFLSVTAILWHTGFDFSSSRFILNCSQWITNWLDDIQHLAFKDGRVCTQLGLSHHRAIWLELTLQNSINQFNITWVLSTWDAERSK